MCVALGGGVAAAQPAPPPSEPHGSATSTPPSTPAPAAPAAPAPGPAEGPAVLEAAQQSIVGLVVVWEEAEDPFASFSVSELPAPEEDDVPVFAVCTGWFNSPTTIVTAGHCVDPNEGRLALHMRYGPRDQDGWPTALPPTALEPRRTVWAFQPRELPGAVLTAPVIVRVDSFQAAEEGDIAKLAVAGLPPARPLPLAPTAPTLGETVTSIGFPGLNIGQTDGVDLEGLLERGKSPAEVLQDSRLRPSNTSGTITAQQFRHGVPVYQVNADLGGGMSGGPTINARGEALGVNSQMTVPFVGQNFNVITDTGMLREFLHPGSAQQTPDAVPHPAPAEGVVAPAHAPEAAGSQLPGQTNAEEATKQAGVADSPGTASIVGWVFAGGLIGGAILGVIIGVRIQRSRSEGGKAAGPGPMAEAEAADGAAMEPVPVQP